MPSILRARGGSSTLDFHRGQQSVLKSVQWQDDEFAQYIEPALDEFFGHM